jgi:hypothetical protein
MFHILEKKKKRKENRKIASATRAGRTATSSSIDL